MNTIGSIATTAASLAVFAGAGYGIEEIARTKVTRAAPTDRDVVRAGLVNSGAGVAAMGLLVGIMGPRMFGFSHTAIGGAMQAVGGMALLGGAAVAVAGTRASS